MSSLTQFKNFQDIEFIPSDRYALLMLGVWVSYWINLWILLDSQFLFEYNQKSKSETCDYSLLQHL